MSCSSCKFLNELDEKKGKVSGACYGCINKKCYVNGSNNKCDSFEKSYVRSSYKCDIIYHEGLKYYDDDTPVVNYVIILILVIIASIVISIVNI